MKLQHIKHSWSKWGRTQTGLEKREPEWSCQACGEKQPESIEPFLFKFANNEYLRICWECQWKVLIRHIRKPIRLLKLCRVTFIPVKIEFTREELDNLRFW